MSINLMCAHFVSVCVCVCGEFWETRKRRHLCVVCTSEQNS